MIDSDAPLSIGNRIVMAEGAPGEIQIEQLAITTLSGTTRSSNRASRSSR
jgi:hypothetical protein